MSLRARNPLDERRIATLATSPALRRFAHAVLGEACPAIRALFVDTTVLCGPYRVGGKAVTDFFDQSYNQ